MIDSCCTCGAEISASARECLVCLTDCGYPNVRAAGSSLEVDALDRRYKVAFAEANSRGLAEEFHKLESTIAHSKAVMNRSLGAVSGWLNGDNPLFLSFHKQVSDLGRLPSNREWDQQRAAAEAVVNPFCFEKIAYAALSLDGEGLTYYGPYSLTLRDSAISHRASLLERNTFYFNRLHQIIAGTSPPAGYKATWSARSKLAVTKVSQALSKSFQQTPPNTLLMENSRNEPDCDFVEVHIFGAIHRAAIERIVGPIPSRRADKLVLKQALRKAELLGISVGVA